MVRLIKEDRDPRMVKFRIDHHNAWDNGRVLHSYERDTLENAEEKARQASIDDPNDIYYVHFDNIMDPRSDYSWYRGKRYTYDDPEYDQIVKAVNNYYGDKYGERLESKSRRNCGKKLKIEESMDSERIVVRSFDELIEKLQELGYHTGAYDSDHMPSDNWLYIGKNHKEYEAEFTKYKDGRYEMMLYNINPTGEDYDLDIDEGCHKKSSKNKKRKVVKEDLYHDAQKEVYDFFMKKQWDLNIPEVANYAEGVVELLELDPEFADGTYTMRDWYKDTQMNYPEDIEWLDSTAY